jgi:hypothetical protein
MGQLLETAHCSEVRQIDELILAVDSLLVDARAAERRPVDYGLASTLNSSRRTSCVRPAASFRS